MMQYRGSQYFFIFNIIIFILNFITLYMCCGGITHIIFIIFTIFYIIKYNKCISTICMDILCSVCYIHTIYYIILCNIIIIYIIFVYIIIYIIVKYILRLFLFFIPVESIIRVSIFTCVILMYTGIGISLYFKHIHIYSNNYLSIYECIYYINIILSILSYFYISYFLYKYTKNTMLVQFRYIYIYGIYCTSIGVSYTYVLSISSLSVYSNIYINFILYTYIFMLVRATFLAYKLYVAQEKVFFISIILDNIINSLLRRNYNIVGRLYKFSPFLCMIIIIYIYRVILYDIFIGTAPSSFILYILVTIWLLDKLCVKYPVFLYVFLYILYILCIFYFMYFIINMIFGDTYIESSYKHACLFIGNARTCSPLLVKSSFVLLKYEKVGTKLVNHLLHFGHKYGDEISEIKSIYCELDYHLRSDSTVLHIQGFNLLLCNKLINSSKYDDYILNMYGPSMNKLYYRVNPDNLYVSTFINVFNRVEDDIYEYFIKIFKLLSRLSLKIAKELMREPFSYYSFTENEVFHIILLIFRYTPIHVYDTLYTFLNFNYLQILRSIFVNNFDFDVYSNICKTLEISCKFSIIKHRGIIYIDDTKYLTLFKGLFSSISYRYGINIRYLYKKIFNWWSGSVSDITNCYKSNIEYKNFSNVHLFFKMYMELLALNIKYRSFIHLLFTLRRSIRSGVCEFQSDMYINNEIRNILDIYFYELNIYYNINASITNNLFFKFKIYILYFLSYLDDFVVEYNNGTSHRYIFSIYEDMFTSYISKMSLYTPIGRFNI